MRIYPTFLSPLWQGPLCHFCGDKVCPFWRNPVSCREGHQFCGSLGTTLIHPQTKPDGKLNWGCPCWRAESIRPSSNSNSSKEQWLVAKVLVFKRMLIGVPSSCWTQFVCFFVHFNPCVGVPTTPGFFFWWIHFLPIKSTCYCWLHPCQLDRLLGLDNCFVGKIHLFSIYCNSTHLADQIPVLIGLCGRIPILLDISQV